MAKYTKQQAVSIIVNCAKKYKECLEGYQLLFIYQILSDFSLILLNLHESL